MRVYYFTPAQFALSDIALRRIKIARFGDLNDPFELLGVNLAAKEHRAAFRRLKETISSGRGLLCFSKNWRNPVIWGHYAEKHTGIALGFDIPDDSALPVNYTDELPPIDIDPVTGTPTREVRDRLLCTKSIDWKYEDEVRLIVKLDHGAIESGMYFRPFDDALRFREVILGPRCELPINGIRELVAGRNPPVTVVKSRIAFSRFEVIVNKRETGKT